MKRLLKLASLSILLATAGTTSAQEPIVGISAKPNESIFKDSAWNRPLVIKPREDAAKHFGKDAIEVLMKKVDFEKQIVLVFAWEGSGGDRLKYVVAESFPEQIFFSMQQGMTFDLRQHALVYALRSNVRWSTGKDKK